ncbi:uncharacterized protein LOC123292966 [Chrysoperla carnea]|uniref:uncharacterized protein LOC123292966 n=1 Tax=Chrysoperla carnea TaxID=189513 RepID=UPI001D09054B|nr:uncharacterized protein LOC123292966 [Chrysoperla carnea]
MDYKYRLVIFTESKKEELEIDIVPTSWFDFDGDHDVLKCRFMPKKKDDDPYDKEELDLLTRMIINCDDPLPSWPLFSVEVRGRARSYEDALMKVTILEKKPYAFSTDSEVKAKEKAQQDEKILKFKTASVKQKLKENIRDVMVDLEDIEHSESTLSTLSNSGNNVRKTTSRKNKYTTQKNSDGIKYSTKKQAKKFTFNNSDDSASISSYEEEGAGTKFKPFLSPSKNPSNKGKISKKLTFKKQYNDTLAEKKVSSDDSSPSTIQEDRDFTKSKIHSTKNSSNIPTEQIHSTKKPEGGNAFEHYLLDMFEDFVKTYGRAQREMQSKIVDLSLAMQEVKDAVMCRDLAQQFTTTKAVQGKKVLKDFAFYQYLKEAMSTIFKEDDGGILNDNTFKGAVKSVMNNVKDWDGQGSVRKQASKK